MYGVTIRGTTGTVSGRCLLDPSRVRDPLDLLTSCMAPTTPYLVDMLYLCCNTVIGVLQDTSISHRLSRHYHGVSDPGAVWQPSDLRYHPTSRSGGHILGLQTVPH